MYNLKDLAGITRVAIGVLWVYMIFNVLGGLSAFYADVVAPQPAGEFVANLVEIVAVGYILALIASFILVGRWIYLASANAHAFSSEMTITPGWAVGWYFIPVASLFKPFEAMKEIWFASHPYGPGPEEGTPLLLRWWWGLWLATNILGNASVPMASGDPRIAAFIDLTHAIVSIPLSLMLMTIMRQIVKGQDLAVRQEIFA